MSTRNTSHQNGQTLIETLATLTISAVLASLAIPGFASLLREQRSQSVIHSLAGAYQLARTSAVEYAQPVIFCAKADERHCGNDWSQGTLVFTDPNKNRIADDDEKILADIAAPPTGSYIKWSASLNRQYLRFTPQGFSESYTAGNLIYCPPGATDRDARNIIFTRVGRLRFGADKNKDGILEDADNKNLQCSG